ncbi:3-hydroxyacyl-ACP dehydratase FabZ family protein [Pelotalea chapellei]|nr:hydroxymyristoyl-ACP dehydratase [Pelotalea chapellei]
MLDRLLALEPGVSACAERQLTGTSGNFPQVCLIECIAQLGGIIAIQEEEEGGFLASINSAEFGELPCAGDILTISAKIVASFGRLFLMEGEVDCGGRMLVRAKLSLGVGKL